VEIRSRFENTSGAISVAFDPLVFSIHMQRALLFIWRESLAHRFAISLVQSALPGPLCARVGD
jgi:hypothetical protein